MKKNRFFEDSFLCLKNYCEAEDFKGWDPYDGLKSKIFQEVPFFKKSRFFRLAWIQFFKRSPLNFRKLTKVEKETNPKGLALFLIGYCNLYRQEPKKEYLEQIDKLSKRILETKTAGYSGACWGYNFDWQARAFFQPAYTPTVVATSFVVEALLKAYEVTKDNLLLKTALSAADFIKQDLNKTYDDDGDFTLSYSPLDETQVYNAGLLGAKTLSLLSVYQPDKKFLNFAKKIVTYVCKKQQENGAWAYGSLPFHQWVDNFHTGYNLECIATYQQVSKDYSYEQNLEKGLKYYVETFFTEEGVSKYYNNQTYPIDIHAPAQLLVTLAKLKKFTTHQALAEKVLSYTIKNMQSSEGYFYYQKRKYFSSKIPYMRWAQAWMFYAFSYYFLEENL